MRRELGLVFALSACTPGSEFEAPAKPAQEVVPGAARLRGGGVRMDVEVGRTFTQRPIKNATVTAKPAAAVVR